MKKLFFHELGGLNKEVSRIIENFLFFKHNFHTFSKVRLQFINIYYFMHIYIYIYINIDIYIYICSFKVNCHKEKIFVGYIYSHLKNMQ